MNEEANFPFFSFMDADRECSAPYFFHIGRLDPRVLYKAAFGDRDEVFVGDFLGGLDEVFFGLSFRGMDDILGKVAVVCDDEKACSVAVQAADGEEAIREVGKEIDNKFFGSKRSAAADISLRFVEHKVNFFLFTFKGLAIDGNIVFFPGNKGLREEDNLSVDRDLSIKN